MKCSKPRFAFWKTRVAPPCARPVRLRVEALEDRLQPSFVTLPLEGVVAHPLPGTFHHTDFALQSTAATDIRPMLALNTATYLTNTQSNVSAGKGRGLILGPDGSVYVAGSIVLGDGSEEGYVAKYSPSGAQVFLTTFQATDVTAPDITFQNTEANGLAIDGVGNIYVVGTATEAPGSAAQGDHNFYTMKLSADGTTVVWGDSFDGPDNLATGTGIAVNDPNQDGNGQAVVVGTYTSTNPTIAPAGNYVLAVRWTADGLGTDFAYIYDTRGPAQALGVSLNNNSTATNPGSLAYIAGNVQINNEQEALALVIDNSQDTNAAGSPVWAARRPSAGSTSDTYTSVAVNPDNSSVFVGTTASTGSSAGLVDGFGSSGGSPVFETILANATALNAVAVDNAGNVYTTGTAANAANGGVYVGALDNQGNVLAEMQFGGTATVDAGYGIVATNAGTVWVVGDTTSASLATDGTTLNGSQDAFLASVTVP